MRAAIWEEIQEIFGEIEVIEMVSGQDGARPKPNDRKQYITKSILVTVANYPLV
jgi:hypothetical protein